MGSAFIYLFVHIFCRHTLYYILSYHIRVVNKLYGRIFRYHVQTVQNPWISAKKERPPVIRRRPCLLERTAGIEPVQSAWEAGILPLNYVRTFNTDIIHHFAGFVKRFLKKYCRRVYFHRLWAKY